VVVGASGIAGRYLIDRLMLDGADFAAVSHSAEGGRALKAHGVRSVLRADFDDDSSLWQAFAGARAVYAIPPALDQREDELVINAVRAAAEAGVKRFVYHSVLHPFTPALRNHMRKARAEAAVRDSGVRWTILQPSMFAQVVIAMFAHREPGVVAVPFDFDVPLAVLDLADLADVGARVLAEDDHDYATYELAGPLTTIANMMTAVGVHRGVELRPEAVSPTEAPLPPAARRQPMAAADMISTFAHYDEHGFRGNVNVLTHLLGRAPATFEQVVARELPRP